MKGTCHCKPVLTNKISFAFRKMNRIIGFVICKLQLLVNQILTIFDSFLPESCHSKWLSKWDKNKNCIQCNGYGEIRGLCRFHAQKFRRDCDDYHFLTNLEEFERGRENPEILNEVYRDYEIREILFKRRKTRLDRGKRIRFEARIPIEIL